MTAVNAAQATVKSVADPNASYETLKKVWEKSRAVCGGERFVKDYDSPLRMHSGDNLLLPFSPSMLPEQYTFYKNEAELPGITAQLSAMIIGGLLRKTPELKLPEGTPDEVADWIINEFDKDDSSLVAFLQKLLSEEIQTSRSWIFVDYPRIENPETLTREDLLQYKPYPILQPAESIVNWRTRKNKLGKIVLDRVIVRGYEEIFDKNEFHPSFYDTVWVHELDENERYRIRKCRRPDAVTQVVTIAGQTQIDPNKATFVEIELIENILNNGEPLNFIPAWPANGSVEPIQPILAPIVDKEVSLYNKISRRNHLLYGAATYTPYIKSNMGSDAFDNVVASGLGTWLLLEPGDDIGVLETPTAALADMDRAIAAGLEEIARLGVRMLTPETDQSGVALEIRNASQTAQIGSLNTRVSNTMKQVIAFMINWRFGVQLKASDVDFSLSTDFRPLPVGADWLRLVTEWYQQALIPRSIWLLILKHNDLVPSDYDDVEGRKEITTDMDLAIKENDDYLKDGK
jgi:hypothetical protein